MYKSYLPENTIDKRLLSNKDNDSGNDNKKDRDSSVPVFVIALNGSRITPVEMPGHMPGPPEVVRDALPPWQLGHLLTATAALRGCRERL